MTTIPARTAAVVLAVAGVAGGATTLLLRGTDAPSRAGGQPTAPASSTPSAAASATPTPAPSRTPAATPSRTSTATQPSRTPAPRPAAPLPAPTGPAVPGLVFAAPLGAEEMVVRTPTDRLIAVSARTGAQTRVLSSRWPYTGIERGPGGTRFYFVRAQDCGEIVEVAVGGRTRVVGDGRRPTVSADGARIAYAGCDGDQGLFVADLADPARRRHYPSHPYPQPGRPGPILAVMDTAWVAGGSRIAVQMGYEGPTELRVLDPETDRVLADGTPISPIGDEIERLGDRLVIVRNCCYAEEESGEVLLRSPADGSTRRVLRSRTAAFHSVVADEGSRRIAYILAGRLYRWDGAGAPVPLRPVGFAVVDW